MNVNCQRRKEDCLFWYFKAMRDIGDDARFMQKLELYQVAGYRVYWSGEYAAKVIRKLLKCPEVVKRISDRVDKLM